jgi:hypothetical protein
MTMADQQQPNIPVRPYLGLAGVALFLATLALRYPGQISFDANLQLDQALSGQFNDWHPPIMAALWAKLLRVGPAAPTMLAVQLLGHWIGFVGIADGLARVGQRRLAWTALASGASPWLLFYLGVIYKDVGLGSALIASFGIAFWYRVQERRIPLLAASISALFLVYATLVRVNAVFAYGPILLFLLGRPRAPRNVALLAGSAMLAVAALPASSFVNRHVLEAEPSGVQQTLQLFDLAGIARRTGDLSVLPPRVSLTSGQLATCYTPLYWDTLNMAVCGFAFKQLPPPGAPARDAIAGLWIRGIVRHPVAYAEHRLMFYNALLNWWVPALQCRDAPFDASCGTPDPKTGRMMHTPDSDRLIRWDYVKKNPLVWPATWLALGLCLFSLQWREAPSPMTSATRALLASALIYALAYLLVGVAADIRYFYWPILAVQTALVINWPRLHSRFRDRDPAVLACIGLMVLVVALGYVARITLP